MSITAYPSTLRLCFFFQAEDGIRDADVTGVQTCALPISSALSPQRPIPWKPPSELRRHHHSPQARPEPRIIQIGRLVGQTPRRSAYRSEVRVSLLKTLRCSRTSPYCSIWSTDGSLLLRAQASQRIYMRELIATIYLSK